MDNIKIEAGARIYVPQSDGAEHPHSATLDHSYHRGDGSLFWVYLCDCGYVGEVHEMKALHWVTDYGVPAPKPEPLPLLDYTEESLISELAEMPIEAECAMHGPGCDFTEFDCEVVEKSHPDAYDYQDVLFEFVRKARELVARRQS